MFLRPFGTFKQNLIPGWKMHAINSLGELKFGLCGSSTLKGAQIETYYISQQNKHDEKWITAINMGVQQTPLQDLHFLHLTNYQAQSVCNGMFYANELYRQLRPASVFSWAGKSEHSHQQNRQYVWFRKHPPNVAVERAVLLLSIRHIQGSNLGPETGHRERFSIIFPNLSRQTVK